MTASITASPSSPNHRSNIGRSGANPKTAKKKPFRFNAEPSAEDIEAELGDFKQRMNYEGTALEAPKFGLSFFCFDYADSKIKVFEITQKTLIKELDKLSQDEDYADIHAWDLKVNRTGLKMNTEYSILPSLARKEQRRGDLQSLGRRSKRWLRSPATPRRRQSFWILKIRST